MHNINRKPLGLLCQVSAERRTVVITRDYTTITSITNPVTLTTKYRAKRLFTESATTATEARKNHEAVNVSI